MSDPLLAEILANPDDDAPRAVWADRLLEANDGWGEFVHLQLALARGGDTVRPTLEPRLRELFAKHRRRREPKVDGLSRPTWVWRRGFVDHVKVASTELLVHAARIFERAPLLRTLETSVGNAGASWPETDAEAMRAFGELLELPGVQRLEGLIVRASVTYLDLEYADEDDVEQRPTPESRERGDQVIELLTSATLPRLHMLGISTLSTAGLAALAASPLAARVDRLVAPWLTAEQLQRYLDQPRVPRLRGLVCGELVEHPKLARLEEVSTRDTLPSVGMRRSIRAEGRWDAPVDFDDWTFRPSGAF